MISGTWGYALNQWKPGHDLFVRREEHERALKTLSAVGFREIELRAGTGRWEPLGRRDRIEDNFGSVGAFLEFLRSCGIDRVCSFFFDPAAPILEESSVGRDPANPNDREGIVASVRGFAELLAELGGSVLAVRPIGSLWRIGEPDAATLAEVAATWSAAADAAAPAGVRVALHVDALSALRSLAGISSLLAACDASVGLAVDTAELALAEIDPLAALDAHLDRVALVHLKDIRVTDHLGERRLPQADREFLTGGGSRGIERWFWELGTPGGLVDLPGVLARLAGAGYTGPLVVESDQSPDPAGSAMLNGWYLQHLA